MSICWLGREWQEVCSALEERGLSYSCKTTFPRGRAKPNGNLRVVRLRQQGDHWEIVLAHEKFILTGG